LRFSGPFMSSLRLDPDTFNKVLRTNDLRTRFQREPDYQIESRTLVGLAKRLATDPRQILQALVESALELCNAGSTGISILDSETGGDPSLFRWRALAGPWAGKYLGATLPREHSPCGVVLSRNSIQLMSDPAEHYDYVGALNPPCHEVLLIPFRLGTEPIGTIWAAMHDQDRHFDAEDARLLSSLAEFASAGYQSLKAVRALEEYGNARAAEVHELSAANQHKDEFIATIAHELRNPLGPIRNTSALLKRGAADPAVVQQAAEVLDRQSNAMARLIDDLLDVSRLRLGVLELHLERVNLADSLRAALEASQLATQTPARRIEVHMAKIPIYVNGDPLRLTQVFGNLLNNAAKYSDTHGTVRIRLELAGQEALVSITDDGIGIASEQMTSIFDLFAQAGQAGTPRSAGGLGIGLHLAKQLVESHGGRLTAASEGVGRGSTFSIRLPTI
jgi:signal transduction histidine kinase